MAWDDPQLLGAPRLTPGQREELVDQVLHDGRHVDRRRRAYPTRVLPLPQVAVDTTYRERQSSFRRFAVLRLFPALFHDVHAYVMNHVKHPAHKRRLIVLMGIMKTPQNFSHKKTSNVNKHVLPKIHYESYFINIKSKKNL